MLLRSFPLVAVICICFIAACFSNRKTVYQPGDLLFPITVKGKYGFINQKGNIVIEPVFRNVGSFVEGLAPARLNGTYGFINTFGEFVISPAYDYAEDFSEGFARVWTGDKILFINKENKRLPNLPDSIVSATNFSNGIAQIVVKSGTEKQKFKIDSFGNLTELKNEEAFVEGLRIRQRSIVKNKEEEDEYAVEDSTGNLIVPFGLYSKINGS